MALSKLPDKYIFIFPFSRLHGMHETLFFFQTNLTCMHSRALAASAIWASALSGGLPICLRKPLDCVTCCVRRRPDRSRRDRSDLERHTFTRFCRQSNPPRPLDDHSALLPARCMLAVSDRFSHDDLRRPPENLYELAITACTVITRGWSSSSL